MGIRKTLGGDRLGAGKRMQVELHNYERSSHDLGYIWRSTMSAGTLVPFMSKVVLPGDTFDIDLDCDIKTHPTIGPLFGSYKVQLDVFFAPVRLYIAELHNNRLGIGMNMNQVKLPQLELIAREVVEPSNEFLDRDNAQINPSCILSYLGIRGVGSTANPAGLARKFNAVPFLAYWEIYKQYYSNKQEEIGAVIHTPVEPIVDTITTLEVDNPLGSGPFLVNEYPAGTNASRYMNLGDYFIITYSGGTPMALENIMLNLTDGRRISLYEVAINNTWVDDGVSKQTVYFDKSVYGNIDVTSWQLRQVYEAIMKPPVVSTFQLSNIDSMKDNILQQAVGVQFLVNTPNLEPYNKVLGNSSGVNHMLNSQEGLGLKTYQSDLFNNWLSTEWIDGVNGISEVTAIDTSGGSFTIDTFVLSKKVYDMLNRIAVSGGSFNDWLDAVYTHDRYHMIESPVYMGGLIKELVFQEVVSNSGTTEGGEGSNQPLGTLAGKGIMSNKHKGGKVVCKVDEPGYIIGIISLTPRIDYSQGNEWDTHLLTMDDFHKPALDQIGFQELIQEQMAWWTTSDVVGNWVTKSAGKQPAWLNYMTSVNKTYGNFAISSNEMFMTLNRRYEAEGFAEITDLTTYIDPSKFNHIFAQTALDAQNFWAQISVDITARRKMSAKLMPNL